MSTHCLGSWPSQPPQTKSAFRFFGRGLAWRKEPSGRSRTARIAIAAIARRLRAYASRGRSFAISRIQMFRKRTGWPWSWSEIGSLSACALYGGRALMAVGPVRRNVALDDDAVVDDRHHAGWTSLPVLVEARRGGR